MKKYLILVKHSLPKVVESVPAREWHLSDEGKLRSELLAQRVASYRPEVLVSSVEPKAIETAQIISNELKLESISIDNLHEHDRSETPYLGRDEFQSVVREFFSKPDELVFGNETANEAHSRFSRAMHPVLEIHKNRTIAIVAHGTVISLFVSRLTGISDILLWSELGLPSFVLLDMLSNTLTAKENIS